MAVQFQYDTIIKYLVTAVCTEPLHIGSAVNDKEAVLVHPLDHLPFVQASSIAGVFRHYYTKIYPNKTETLFGMNKSKTQEESFQGSRLRITDGKFEEHKLVMELRPRLQIDPETGTCNSSLTMGSQMESGHKFNMEYIGKGAEFSFEIYLYDKNYQQDMEDIFTAIQQEDVQFGGQKSNGCGYIRLKKLKYKVFDMKNKDDRKKWEKEAGLEEKEYKNLIPKIEKRKKVRNCYEILVKGETEGQLLVKSIAVTEYGKNAPKCVNIRNAEKDYIIPGSSFKGAVRNQMEKIAAYLQKEEIIEDTFGIKTEKNKKGKTGNIQFFDTVIGNKEENDNVELSHRIHIDKFTGGVINGELFSEKNVFGKVEFKIVIQNKNNPERSCAILLMALRDLAIGTMSIGGGYNVGKGIINVSTIHIIDYIHENAQAVMDFQKNKITDKQKIIENCIKAINKEEA